MDKEKVFKPANVSTNNIHPGDLKRSPDDCFSKTLVFIDAGFLSKLSKYFGGGKYLKYDLIQFCNNLAKKQNLFCEHIYYYTSPPFQSDNPVKEESERYRRYEKFRNVLSKNKIISIREGRCQRLKRDGSFVLFDIKTDKINLLISPEYEVYVRENNFNKSLVDKILIEDCFLNAFSSDQIGKLKANASAKYGASLLCGESLPACDKNFSYLDFSIISISCLINENKKSNSTSLIFENFINFCLSLDNSSSANLGDNNLLSQFNSSSIKYLLAESCLKNENNMLASTTKVGIILDYNSCLFATLSFSSEPHSDACLSVISLLDNISLANENCNLLVNCLTTLDKANSNLSLNSAGISTLTIISVIDNLKNSDYINLSDFNLFGKEIYSLNSENKPIKVQSIYKKDFDNSPLEKNIKKEVKNEK